MGILELFFVWCFMAVAMAVAEKLSGKEPNWAAVGLVMAGVAAGLVLAFLLMRLAG